MEVGEGLRITGVCVEIEFYFIYCEADLVDLIHQLAAVFDLPTTPYICQPNPAYAPKYSDYLHLARVAEWSVTEEGGE